MGKAERWAALVVIAIGAPMMFMFARAMADGEARRREAPLRGLLGDQVYEQLATGGPAELHYMGNQLSAPNFTLPDREDAPYELAAQRGKVVVMNFWTITCQPCLEEMPSLIELARIAQNREDLEVIAVTTDENWEAVASVFPPDAPLKVLFDPDKKVVRDKFGTRLFPETWVIDRRGVVRLRVDGPREWASPLALDAIESFL